MKLSIDNSEENISQRLTSQTNIDWHKMGVVTRKGVPWIIFILLLTFTAAFLIIRYTKPVYESFSEIKLGQEDKSNVLNIPQVDNGNSFGLLSSEMELITSRLFFNKVIESVRLNPQYFTYGQFLVDEKYSNPPFSVDYQLKNITLYNSKIDITILNNTRFLLEYSIREKEFSKEYGFDEPIENEDMALNVTLSPSWNSSMDHEYYFVINSHDVLIKYLESNLSVEPVNLEANIFRVSFKDYSLSKAHALISAIDTLYYNYSLDEKNRANRNKIDYLNSQLAETEEKLDDYEKYFEDITITNKTVSLEEDVRRTVTMINGLDSQKVRLQNKLADLNKLSNEIKAGHIVTIPTIDNKFPSHIINLIDELNLLINEREKLGLSYKQNTYTYRSRQKEIDLLKADLLAQINNTKVNIVDDINFLGNEKVRLNQQLNKLPSKSTEYNKVKRFYSLYEEIYLSLMQSKNEFEIAIAGSTTKIKILSPANMPEKPIKPNQLIVYGLSTAIFFLLSLAFLVISYFAHDRVNNINDIERSTNATLLGAVPKYKSNEKDARIVVDKHPKSVLSESMRTIRTNMEFMLLDRDSKVFSFTSTIGSEGKTFISTNLGCLLAMGGKKVIVLDLDLRRPKVHKAFGNELKECGMSTLLSNKHSLMECVTTSGTEGLYYIGAGPIPPNPSELLLRDAFDKILLELKKEYDVVILDTPPVGIVTDGLLVMQKADLPIYILRANYSKLAFLNNINRLIDTGRYPNLSVILNNVTTKKSGYGYGNIYTNNPYYQE